MNTLTPSPNSVLPTVALASPYSNQSEEFDIAKYLDILVVNKWLIAAVTAVVLGLGIAYALLSRPIYESNILIQVEDPVGTGSKSLLAEASSFFDVKMAASSEMEIIRSRMIVGGAVEATKLYISANPKYAPIIGGWLARRATGLSNPGFLGMSGYVTGAERIVVSQLDVPESLEFSQYVVKALADGQYQLTAAGWTDPAVGSVGKPLTTSTPQGPITLLITRLDGKPGAEFIVNRSSKLATVEGLQQALLIAERGKQSGVISVGYQSVDPFRLTQVLNAVGDQYVQQNVERKAAEAQKTLTFLDTQLPIYKRQLEQSEEVYNRYRNQKGTVVFDEEARLVLQQVVDRQTKLLDAQQKRRELEGRFTPNHPQIQTLDAQIAALSAEIGGIQAKIKALPAVQQDAVRMERDLKVNTELYQSMLNNALQLRLVKEGKVGTVRLLDHASLPENPIKPQRRTIVSMALLLGLFLGVMAAFIRSFFVEQRIRDPHEVEMDTALPVFSSIPLSGAQASITNRRLTGASGVRLLTVERPDDPAVESLRSLRTAMQFAMLESPNNRVMISGPTPGVGKSFVTANFAALMASAEKKTLLIDADLRRGHLHQYLGLQRHGGLSELIAGSLTIAQTVHRNVITNLDFLATGQLPPNPAELLVSDSFRAVLDKLSDEYDLVVIDTPPVLVAADASTLASNVGTLLLVARVGITTLGELRESKRRLTLTGKTAAGVLLNGMDAKNRVYQSYRYGRYRYTNYNYESILPENQ